MVDRVLLGQGAPRADGWGVWVSKAGKDVISAASNNTEADLLFSPDMRQLQLSLKATVTVTQGSTVTVPLFSFVPTGMGYYVKHARIDNQIWALDNVGDFDVQKFTVPNYADGFANIQTPYKITEYDKDGFDYYGYRAYVRSNTLYVEGLTNPNASQSTWGTGKVVVWVFTCSGS